MESKKTKGRKENGIEQPRTVGQLQLWEKGSNIKIKGIPEEQK